MHEHSTVSFLSLEGFENRRTSLLLPTVMGLPLPHCVRSRLPHLSSPSHADRIRSGNNAIAFKGSQTSKSAPGQFILTQNPNQAPTVQANLDAARTNAFHVVNTVHDILFVYGFTERTFNFQINNFGNGGAGNDRVTILVQDSR